MKLLMVSGDRSILQGKKSAFWYTLEEFSKQWERVDVVVPKEVTSYELRVTNARNSKPETHNPFPNVFFHPSSRKLWYQPWWILIKGDELIKEHHHEVMTVQEYPPFYNGIGARWLHRSTKIPYCLEIHHIIGYPVAASFVEWIGRILSRFYLRHDARNASVVRTVNQTVRRTLIEWGIPTEKISVVPSFYLDTSVLTPDPSITKTFDVVFCARLVSNKGLSDVIKAVAQIPDATLLIIGDGPERSRCEALAESLNMKNRVTFRGWIGAQQDYVRAMQSAHVFVMHSTSEGGPRVALEAMACGMPVIATKVGVMPDVIQDGVNGLFTDGTAEGLVQKLRLLLGDLSKQDSIGREARRIVETFERKKLVKDYASFLQSVSP